MTSLDPNRNLVRKIGVLGVAIDSSVAAVMSGLRIRSGVLVVAQALDAGGTQTGLEAGGGLPTAERPPGRTPADLPRPPAALKTGGPAGVRVGGACGPA